MAPNHRTIQIPLFCIMPLASSRVWVGLEDLTADQTINPENDLLFSFHSHIHTICNHLPCIFTVMCVVCNCLYYGLYFRQVSIPL